MDPTLSLAFSMQSNPGVYALLVGSGISRSAAIPTGWEIVLDLIGKLAAVRGDDCGASPEDWYERAFGDEPDYSKLLRALAKRPAERQRLLSAYFEASLDDEAAGLKQPTTAHTAIAELVRSGHVRVILTTNFDRLLERSLEAVGVSPTVISTDDAIEGAIPITHSRCTVVKLHGDYLDARIKNTPDELAKYSKTMNRLLDRILDEFGLVVCGWSGDWDLALRAAIERCKSRRFTTYWAAKDGPTDAAQRLIGHRSGEVIPIADADQFFADLQQKVTALAQSGRPHPLSAKTAIATMKRLLPDARHRIELRDLVHGEVERVFAATSDERLRTSGPLAAADGSLRRRLEQYEAITEIVRALLVTGCYWGADEHSVHWIAAIERLANRPAARGHDALSKLARYPALLLLYSAGLAAVANRDHGLLRAILIRPRMLGSNGSDKTYPVMERICPNKVLDQETACQALGRPRAHTPVSDHLFHVLRDSLRDYLPDDEAYEEAFDRFEYLWAILDVDAQLAAGVPPDSASFPVGRFAWRKDATETDALIANKVRAERFAAEAASTNYMSGFVPSFQRFDAADREIKSRIIKLDWS